MLAKLVKEIVRGKSVVNSRVLPSGGLLLTWSMANGQPAAGAWLVLHNDAAGIGSLQLVDQATRCHIGSATG